MRPCYRLGHPFARVIGVRRGRIALRAIGPRLLLPAPPTALFLAGPRCALRVGPLPVGPLPVGPLPVGPLPVGRAFFGLDGVVFLVFVLQLQLRVDQIVRILDQRAHQARIPRNRRRQLGHHARCGLELVDHIVRADQRRIGLDAHAHPVARLDHADMLALLVHQEVDHRNRRFQQHFLAALARAFFFQRPDDGQRQAVVGPDQTRPMAMRTRLGRRLQHPRTQPLTAHLQQTEPADPAHLNACPIGFQLVLQAFFHRQVVAPLFHVDEVDHDQPGQIAQPQLPRHLVRGFKVGLECRLFDRAFLGGPTRVHVDRHQRLGHPDHDVAAGFQLHRRVEHARKVAFHLVFGEQRHRIVVALHQAGMAWHDHPHEILGGAIAGFALHQNLVDLAAVQIADRALDQITFFIDGGRGHRLEGQLANLFPQPHQVFIVAPDLGFRALGTCGADDQASAFRHLDLIGNLAQLLAVGSLGDLARNATAARGVGHQHAVAPGQRQISGQRRALVATFFLDHLHQHDLAHLDDFLNLVASTLRLAAFRADLRPDILFGDRFNFIVGLRRMIHRPVARLGFFRVCGGLTGLIALRSVFRSGRRGISDRSIGMSEQCIRAGFVTQINHIHPADGALGHRIGRHRSLRPRSGRARLLAARLRSAF